MFSEKHLALRRVHLAPKEKWVAELNKLSFVFVHGGGGQYVSRSVTHRLLPGDVLILNPTSDGGVRAFDGGEIEFSFFSVRPEHLFPMFGGGEISLLHNACEGFKATRLFDSTTAVARESHRLLAQVPAGFSLEHRGQLLRVAAAILDAEFRSAQSNVPGFVRSEDHLLQQMESLTTDDLVNLSVQQLAARFGCSKRHLSRLFHRVFGFSVAAMKMEVRLLMAVSLLRDPDMKIINVAEQCGFHYLGLFNTTFKKRFMVTPSQLRKFIAAADNPSFRLTKHIPTCPMLARGLCLHADNAVRRQPVNAKAVAGQKPCSLMPVLTMTTSGSGLAHKKVAPAVNASAESLPCAA